MHCWASMVVRWLRHHLPLQWVQVPSSVGDQRSHKPYIVSKRKGKKRYVYSISKNPFILGEVEELRHQFSPWFGKTPWRRK